MNFATATASQASNYSRGTTVRTPDQTAHSIRVADWAADEARNVTRPASPDIASARTDIINLIMFLTADLGPSINR